MSSHKGNFSVGFEKIAVSAKFVGSHVAGGLATRTGIARGSSAHTELKNMGAKILEAGSHFKASTHKQQLSKIKKIQDKASTTAGAQKGIDELRSISKRASGDAVEALQKKNFPGISSKSIFKTRIGKQLSRIGK
jgi:hypothetical protein